MATLFLDAQHVEVHQKSFDESLLDLLSQEESDRLDQDIQRVATSNDPIGILSQSIAPEIFGHADIKRALLLQLTSGVTRSLQDGMKIRGDINVLLMGDPGVAKSQLLKHVASVAPRGVYTTGKGSSGVGLTAAITKDTVTGEMSLEGGALVLADRGICAIVSIFIYTYTCTNTRNVHPFHSWWTHSLTCLLYIFQDEFDKMDETDRTAIHEVMEQQTVSIAKAGIVATLNARTAVLAAANPLYSRYNRSKSLSENINLPNSLLSRFDLTFLILDTPDVDKDMALARHVTFVHQNEGLVERTSKINSDDDDSDDDNDDIPSDYDEDKGTVSARLLREYIARARRHEPSVPTEVAPYVVEAYVSLRMQDRPNNKTKGGNDQTAMTARQLLSILRISQALARLRFSDFVAREDVDEAIRLTHMSKSSLEDSTQGTKKKEDVMSRVYKILRDYATTCNSESVELRLAEAMVLRKGFTNQQLQSCLEEYEALKILQVDQNRTHVHFVS
jgi:DNA replication licensing factor MCM7